MKSEKVKATSLDRSLSLFGSGTRVFASGEDTLSLRLTSELADLRSGYANPILRLRSGTECERTSSAAIGKEKSTPFGVPLPMAAELGFEPRHTESESAVLPLHNSAKYGKFKSIFVRLIILAHKNCFVNTFVLFLRKFCFLFEIG